MHSLLLGPMHTLIAFLGSKLLGEGGVPIEKLAALIVKERRTL